MHFFRDDSLKGLTALGIGLLGPFTINLVGNMPLAELLIMAVAAVLLVQVCVTRSAPTPLVRNPIFWAFLLCQALALCGYIVSDLYRESATNDALRGWSRMIFLAMDIVVLGYLFTTAPASFLWFQGGAALGGVAYGILHLAEIGDPWKFGFAGPATQLTLLVAPLAGFTLGAVVVGALGILHLVLDYRSLGGVCLLLAMLLGLQLFPRRLRAVVLPVALLAGCAATFWFYQAQQARGDGQRGGRSDVERSAMIGAAWQGFQESPLIGQGSWFSKSRVMDYFLERRSEAARLAGVHGYSERELEDNLAIHSQILVACAEGGIFGGAFFFFYGAMLLWGLAFCAAWRVPDRWSGIYLLSLMMALWNLLLSPFSGTHRLGIAMACGLLLVLWQEWRTRTRPWSEPQFADAPPPTGALLPRLISCPPVSNPGGLHER